MKDLLIVGIGGFIGSSSRYGIFLLMSKYFSDKTYLATLIVNLLGCLLIGWLGGIQTKLSTTQTLLLVTGLCGGFTTFSTYAFDGVKLFRAGLQLYAFGYLLISVIGGLLLCIVGFQLASK